MATTTVQDLITAALMDLGVVQPGQSPTPGDSSTGLDRFNDWIDALKLDNLTVYTYARSTWTIVANTASYTVGSGGTVNIPRPVSANVIQNIGYQDTSVSPTLELLKGPPLTEDQYAAIPQKTYTSVYPEAFYYNPTFASSLGRLWVFPIPTSTTLQGVIYAPAPIDEYAALTTTLALPPGYRRFYRTNLTVELAPAWNQPITPDMRRLATESAADVKRNNVRLCDMPLGMAGALFGRGPWYDINAGP